MKQDHRPWDKKVFSAGANTDAEPQSVANTQGMYRDAQNMRLMDNNGSNGSLVKIKGESIRFGAPLPEADSYWCIGEAMVNGNEFAIWASEIESLPSVITINGIPMVVTTLLPYRWDRPLQLDVAADCYGGLVFDARSGSIPIHWDVADIIRAHNAGETTYTTGFNLATVQVNPTRPVNRPMFRGLQFVGNGGGVPGGQRFYRIRYVNSNGDRTPLGPPLGPVFVPFFRGQQWQGIGHRPMPHADVAGAAPLQVGVPTGWGVQLRFRVNNVANFQSIEVVCEHYSTVEGPDQAPVVQVVERIAIEPGANLPLDITDIGQTLDEIAPDESVIQTYFINSANAVRYINFRVVYGGVELGAKNIQGEWLLDGGQSVVPITKSIGRDGHADPVNTCYYRRMRSGERYGIGAVFYDTSGGNSYVDVVNENYQAPNRRDLKAGLSAALSDAPIYAANVNHEVSPTFEVFDLEGALTKSQVNQVVNIMEGARRKVGSAAFTAQATTNPPVNGPGDFSAPGGGNYGQPNDGVYVSSGESGGPYLRTSYVKPFRPDGPSDVKWGLDYNVNTRVRREGTPTAGTALPYNPAVFAVNNHTLGGALVGLSSIPDGQQGLSVVVTKPAKRVAAQGIAKWRIIPGTDLPPFGGGQMARKDLFQLHICLPEFNSGTLNEEVWQGILAADGRYGLQMVSPLGIATEQYGSVMADAPQNDGSVSALADLLSIARVLWDNGQINPGNNSGGYTPSAPLPGNPDHFTGFDAWRNAPRPDSPWHAPGMNGNRVLSYSNATEIQHPSGERSLVITVDAQVYARLVCGSSDFASAEARGWHEPWYVVNFVQDGVQPDGLEGYQSVNHYLPFRSVIGRSTGAPGQVFTLVDERTEDVWAPGQERLVYVLADGQERPYLFDGAYPGQTGTILQAIVQDGSWTSPAGTVIYGLYSVQFGATEFDVSITFLIPPPAGAAVEVRYRLGSPIKFFGDHFVAPALGTMVNLPCVANPPNGVGAGLVATQGGTSNPAPYWPTYSPAWFSGTPLYLSGLPVPFANYEYNGNYLVPFGMGHGAPQGPSGRFAINQYAHGMLASTRQWIVMFDGELTANLFMSRWEPNVRTTYPNVNYVQRPYNFLPNATLAENGIGVGYSSHYQDGPAEWYYGGFKVKQLPLPAYSLQRLAEYVLFPEFGYEERTKQCSALIYSNRATPVQQDLPGLRTFPVNNIEYIEPTKGTVQYLYAGTANATGYNLYAIMERGIRLVLTEQSIARSTDGEAFTMFSQDNFVGGQLWIEGAPGMPGETWQTAAEGSPPAPGSSMRGDALMWSDGESYYMLMGNQVIDVAKGRYRKAIKDALTSGTFGRLSGAYDQARDEAYLGTPDGVLVFACSAGTHTWQGRFTYRFHRYLFNDVTREMLGMRQLRTFTLNQGDDIGNRPVQAWVKVPSAPFPGERMQWLNIKIDSPRKPKRVEFYDEFDQLVCWLDAQFTGSLGFPAWSYLKKITNWEQQVPSINASVDPAKPKLQGALAYYKVIFEDVGEDKVVRTEIQVKPLK